MDERRVGGFARGRGSVGETIEGGQGASVLAATQLINSVSGELVNSVSGAVAAQRAVIMGRWLLPHKNLY